MSLQVSLMIEIDATADLLTLEHQVQEAGHQAMRHALRDAIHQWELAHRCCPSCGSFQVRGEGTVSRTLHALFGKVHLARQRFRCQHCLHRFTPANDVLHALQGARVSPALIEAATVAGSSWPYRQAAHLLSHLSGAQISAEEIRLLTNLRGHRCAKEQEQVPCSMEISALVPEEQGHTALDPTDRLMIGLDGGWVPSREQRGGMEGKVAVIATNKELVREPRCPSKQMTYYELEKYLKHHRHPSVKRSRWAQRRYVATFASSSVVGKEAAEAASQIGSVQQEQVVIADGAAWIKSETEKHFPEATRILDWPHLWRTIAKAVRAVALQQERDQAWVHQEWKHLEGWLWKGEVQSAQSRLLRWQEEQKGHPPVKALKTAITYLKTQEEWMGNYEQWRQQGYPVGSGMIERAVAVVINRRMKRRGMSWLRKNATAVVALRVELLNEDWLLPPTMRMYP